MNAINLLTADHRDVETLFKKTEGAARAAKRELFFRIKAALEAHAWVEETVFYPTIQSEGDEELVGLTAEALQEHLTMKCMLGELAAVATDPSRFEPLLDKLIEDVRHHVEEEEGEMFPMVAERLSADTLEALGDQMEGEKSRFMASAETLYV